MNRDPFQSFVDLIQFDQQIYAAKNELQGLQLALDKITQEEQQFDKQLDSAQQLVHNARFEVDQKELEMKILDDLEKDKKKKLEQIANPKEYRLLSEEINRIKKQQHDREEEVLQVWQQLESAKRIFDLKQAEVDAIKTNLQESKNVNIQMAEKLEQDIARLEQERPRGLQNIPEEWLEKYSAMRERVSDPVVPVQFGSCSACFHNILEKDMSLLHKRALLQCKGCFRFLYLPEAREGAGQ